MIHTNRYYIRKTHLSFYEEYLATYMVMLYKVALNNLYCHIIDLTSFITAIWGLYLTTSECINSSLMSKWSTGFPLSMILKFENFLRYKSDTYA